MGTDVMDRLTEAAGMLRIGGLANRADKAEGARLRRAAPVENLRQRYQEQEGTAAPERPQRAPFNWWWNNAITNRIAQVQNVIYARVEPLQADNSPPPPLRPVPGVDDLRTRFRQDEQRQARPQQGPGPSRPPEPPRSQSNNQAEPRRGILRRSSPARDLRVRFADDAGPSPGRGLRRRPPINDLRGRYQQDVDDDLAL